MWAGMPRRRAARARAWAWFPEEGVAAACSRSARVGASGGSPAVRSWGLLAFMSPEIVPHRASQRQQAVLDAQAQGLRAAAGAQLGVQRGDVVLDRVLAPGKLPGDLLVR